MEPRPIGRKRPGPRGELPEDVRERVVADRQEDVRVQRAELGVDVALEVARIAG